MARRKNRDIEELSNRAGDNVSRWKLGIYIRLSKEDICRGKDESNSVVNQKKLLDDYYRRHSDEFESVGQPYVDDGCTGTDTNREGFQKLLADIYAKKVNCVIVKDLSRLSRNYTEAGSLIENLFVQMNVRFISLTEGVDSYKNPDSVSNILVPITNVINDQYCYQTSKKIRQVFDYKRRQGEFIGAFAPYGYDKHPEHKNNLIVDEETAPIVQNIFEWFVQGMSKNGIAFKLNGLGVLNPAGYKKSKGLKCNHPGDAVSALWSASTVARILENQMYTGTMVQGKYRIMSYKVHTQIRTERDEWFIVENTHEPIISKELFQAAQSLQKKDTRTAPANNEVYLFSGFLRCYDCRKAMHRRATGKYVYYICRTYKEKSRTACTRHTISHNILENAVLTAIQRQIDLVVTMRDFMTEINAAPVVKNRSIQPDRAIEAKRRELDKVNRYQKNLYQDMCDELITRIEYNEMRADYKAQAERIQAAINTLSEERRLSLQEPKENSPQLAAFIKYENFECLSREILTELVDCIYIKEDGGISIQFKFADHFKHILS